MKNKPSTKGKGKIRKILARGRVVDPDPRNRRPKLPIPKKKAPSSPNRENMLKNAMSPANVAKKIASAGVSFKTKAPAVSTAAPNIKPKVPKPPRGPRTPPPPPAKQPKAVPNLDPAEIAKIRETVLSQDKRQRDVTPRKKPVAKKTSGSGGSGESQKDSDQTPFYQKKKN